MFRRLPPRASAVLCTIAALLLASGVAFRAAAPEQTRALWVTRATLASPEAIRQMVTAAQSGGFNTLLVQVRGRGDAYYAGTIEPRAPELAGKPAFDPLATVLEQAHGAGLKVHAWVAVNLVSSSVTLPASRDHVIYRAPEWLMVPRELAARSISGARRMSGGWLDGRALITRSSKVSTRRRCILPPRITPPP
jgi:uncharacterized lipoprotein YddW (UPF0748 family)